MDLNDLIRTTGRKHLEAIRKHEENFKGFVEETARIKPSPDTPELLDALGTALAYLNGIASCDWGCNKESAEHVRRHLIGRATSNLQGSFLLLSSSYIPEAIACYRSAMEVANLLNLFLVSPESLEQFISSGKSKRDEAFGAGNVRRRLEALDSISLIGQDEYRVLSRDYVHPVTNPSALFLGNRTTSQPNIRNAEEHVLPILLYLNLMAQVLLASGMDLLEIDREEDFWEIRQVLLKLNESAKSYLAAAQAK